LRKAYRIIATLTLAAVAALSFAAAAPAKARDRNHDRIPDRWEKRHNLSLKVKQARRDQDRDGLTNLGEFRAGTHPRDPDTDGDGVEDGDENAGRVVSFDGDVLTLSLAGGGTLSARVGEDTKVKCRYDHEKDEAAEDDDAVAKPSRMPGESVEQPVDKPEEDGLEPEERDDEAEEDAEKDHEDGAGEEKQLEESHVHCGLDAIDVGDKVSEAKLELRRGRLFWTKLELR